MRTLKFEDHGQDFLEWDIDRNGVVIDCRPFQSVWIGTKVYSPKRGQKPTIKTRFSRKKMILNHRIKSIVKPFSTVCRSCGKRIIKTRSEWLLCAEHDLKGGEVKDAASKLCEDPTTHA